MIKTKSTTYEAAGVMRCCIQTLEEWVSEHELAEDGQVVQCKYERPESEVDSGFVLRGHVWKVRMFDPLSPGN